MQLRAGDKRVMTLPLTKSMEMTQQNYSTNEASAQKNPTQRGKRAITVGGIAD